MTILNTAGHEEEFLSTDLDCSMKSSQYHTTKCKQLVQWAELSTGCRKSILQYVAESLGSPKLPVSQLTNLK